MNQIVYSADGQKLATAGNDGRVILWEPAARKRKVGEAQLAGPSAPGPLPGWPARR